MTYHQYQNTYEFFGFQFAFRPNCHCWGCCCCCCWSSHHNVLTNNIFALSKSDNNSVWSDCLDISTFVTLCKTANFMLNSLEHCLQLFISNSNYSYNFRDRLAKTKKKNAQKNPYFLMMKCWQLENVIHIQPINAEFRARFFSVWFVEQARKLNCIVFKLIFN